MKSDKDLQSDVLDELQWEPSIDAAEIGVAAHDGVVTLTGGVTTFLEKLTAERVSKRVHGVKAIANDLEVRLRGTGERNDTDIAQAAIDALRWRTTVPEEHVKITVSKGWVTLEGEVDWYFQRESAEDAVRLLLGVRGVTNLVTIKPKASSAEVKGRIEAAFLRSAELDAKQVRVETHHGKVTLKGDVRSWSERQEAERTAWAAPGVSAVDNQIVVAPYITAY